MVACPLRKKENMKKDSEATKPISWRCVQPEKVITTLFLDRCGNLWKANSGLDMYV